MTIDRILETVGSFDGVLVLAPEPGGPHPEIAWGDFFFYFAPDGEVPANQQPFATIVTKDYPDDGSRLGEGRWRVNIHVGKTLFSALVGDRAEPVDFAEPDVFLPHPVYGALGWVSVVNPGVRTMPRVLDLLRGAYRDARDRAARRALPDS